MDNSSNSNQDQGSSRRLLQDSDFPSGIIKPRHLAADTTMVAGDMYQVNANGIFQRIPAGTNGQVLSVTGGVLGFTTPVTLSIARQNITANTVITSPVIQTGWSYCLQSNGASTITSKAITFPNAYSSAPTVLIAPIGIKYTTAPTLIGDLTTSFTSDALLLAFGVDSITTTGFNVSGKASGNAGADTYRGFSWIAIG